MNRKTGMILMAAVMVARGSSFIFSKQLMEGFAPMNVLAVRFITAFLVLCVIFYKKILALNVKTVLRGTLLGGCYTACMAAEMYGLRLIDSGTCSFIENAAVVIVPIYAAILSRRFPKKKILLIAFIAFIGVGFLTVTGGGTMNAGIWLAILAALIYGICVMVTKAVTKESDPVTIGIIQLGAMGVFSLIITFIIDTPRMPQSNTEWLMILMLALVCSCFGFTFQPLAQKYISVETASIFTAVNPLTTCFIGIIFANESAHIFKFIGGGLIIGAVLLSVFDKDLDE